jgi:hypothetical protein
MEAHAQLIGWDPSLLYSLRQPKIAAGNATETNQQNDGAEHCAGPGDGNRNYKRDGEKRGQEHEAFLPKNVSNVGYIHPLRRQGGIGRQ